ncbi:MAG: heavy-metal-associated domain-containing protein [Bifidobacteriaceae bacterium]|jgi:copper chaperone CopZ|nr:heavy-metal-associated domain-containing protein [Bifidobacteriaceae bacterium]MCI1915227.1 heavy-metal-associated domain-containing protein [Bifidobacteriaceae bacterium]
MKKYDIEGMKCDGCATKVQDAFVKVPGVVSAQVNLSDKTASVEGKYDEQALLDSLKDTHYTASPAE